MNKNLLLIGGLLVAGAVGAFLFLKKPALPGTIMAPGGQETVSASFADLVKMGQDYTCTFESTNETTGAETSGLVYVADQGNKLNGEFVQQSNDVATKTNVIRDGEYTYFWSSADAKGYKMKIDPAAESLFGEQSDKQTEKTGFDENEAVDFECAAWTPQANLFVPPSDIEFMDMSAQMEMMQQQMEAMPAMPESSSNGQYCGACAQLEGQAQAQCLTAMGC